MFSSPSMSSASLSLTKLALATTCIGIAFAAFNNKKLGALIAGSSLIVACSSYFLYKYTKPKPKQTATDIFDVSEQQEGRSR